MKLLKSATELASYAVTISPADMASLSPMPSAFTIGNSATEFTLTTNVSAGIKVQVTQGTGTMAMFDANGTPSCESPLDIEENVTNGGKVKIIGCTAGDATVKLLKGATELKLRRDDISSGHGESVTNAFGIHYRQLRY